MSNKKTSKIVKKATAVSKKSFRHFDPRTECYVVIPDVHSYERDVAAFEIMMASLPIFNEIYKVSKVIQLGDLLEVGEFSGHPRNNVYDKIEGLKQEIAWAKEGFWDRIKSAIPKAEMYALMGNHEDRLQRKLAKEIGNYDLAKSALETSPLNPEVSYNSWGINVIPFGGEDPTSSSLSLLNGELICTHGWSFSRNAASTHLSKLMGARSVIFGHTHRSQSDVRFDAFARKTVAAINPGSLAKNHMWYQKGAPSDHTNGFCIVLITNGRPNIYSVAIHQDNGKYFCTLPSGDYLEI
jgi:predicted phosphodiesterase